jgi:hypothetical protein
VNTCGKFVITFANASSDGLSLDQYLKLLEGKHKETGLSYDEIVCNLYEMF